MTSIFLVEKVERGKGGMERGTFILQNTIFLVYRYPALTWLFILPYRYIISEYLVMTIHGPLKFLIFFSRIS